MLIIEIVVSGGYKLDYMLLGVFLMVCPPGVYTKGGQIIKKHLSK